MRGSRLPAWKGQNVVEGVVASGDGKTLRAQKPGPCSTKSRCHKMRSDSLNAGFQMVIGQANWISVL